MSNQRGLFSVKGRDALSICQKTHLLSMQVHVTTWGIGTQDVSSGTYSNPHG